MPMWSDLPDQADVDARRAARLDRRRAAARRSRLRRLSVTLTTLALLITGGVVVLRSTADSGTVEAAPVSASTAVTSSSPSLPVADRAREAVAAAITSTAAPEAPTAAPTEQVATGPVATDPADQASTATKRSSDTPDDLAAEELPVVSEGDYGTVVEVAQRALDVEPTGYFGPKTRAAVAEYQQELGLPTTGQIATFTWSALGEETVASALAAVDTPDGYVDAEPAQLQESAQPKASARNIDAGDPPVLEETDSGESVAVVQRALGVKPATGYFGPLTVKAVKRFQSDNGIPTTGVIATYTWGALGKQTARDAAVAHASYGTAFGPGAPKDKGNGGSGGGNGGGSTSQGRDGLFCPVKNFSYGDGLGAARPGGRTHEGLDLMGGRGEPIYAIDSGTVTRSGYQSNGAMILDITGPRGMYFYGHFDKITVGYGDSVKAGQLIGYMGDTGSPGAVHLHLEVRPNGWSGGYDDPVPLIKSLCG